MEAIFWIFKPEQNSGQIFKVYSFGWLGGSVVPTEEPQSLALTYTLYVPRWLSNTNLFRSLNTCHDQRATAPQYFANIHWKFTRTSRLLSYPMSTFIKVNVFGSKIFIMYLATVLTHDMTVFNQSHRFAAKIPLRPTWVLDLFGTKDAVDYIIFLDQ